MLWAPSKIDITMSSIKSQVSVQTGLSLYWGLLKSYADIISTMTLSASWYEVFCESFSTGTGIVFQGQPTLILIGLQRLFNTPLAPATRIMKQNCLISVARCKSSSLSNDTGTSIRIWVFGNARNVASDCPQVAYSSTFSCIYFPVWPIDARFWPMKTTTICCFKQTLIVKTIEITGKLLTGRLSGIHPGLPCVVKLIRLRISFRFH